jgi:hypothetical protein
VHALAVPAQGSVGRGSQDEHPDVGVFTMPVINMSALWHPLQGLPIS